MRPKTWHTLIAFAALLLSPLLTGCNEKATEPEDELDVTNTNPYCGMVAGFVKNSSGTGLGTATVSITPIGSGKSQTSQHQGHLQSFLNYPNPFTTHTYFTYYLADEAAQSVTISVYNLQRELMREFLDAPTVEGPHKVYFDGLDDQEEPLPNGLYPCEVLVLSPGDTSSVRMALSKNVNVAGEGGLQSYTVTTQSNGKYVIANVPLNILLQSTNVVAPLDSIEHPNNWPFPETSWQLTDHFEISVSKGGYTTATDTAHLGEGQVTRVDFTLQ
jgi:flagellar hook assembly protein FlgD